MNMKFEENWKKAVKETEIYRVRLKHLSNYKDTNLPYIFLSESVINTNNTVVRKGNIIIDKPLIFFPSNFPQFEGFNFEEDYHISENILCSFLLIRGINLPSLKFKNQTYTLEVLETSLEKTIKYFLQELEKKENIDSGLIVGPDDVWQFSLLIYAVGLMNRSLPYDIESFLKDLRQRMKDN